MRNAMLDWIEAADARLALQEAGAEHVPTGASAYTAVWCFAALGLIAFSALAAAVEPAPSQLYAGLMQVMT